MLASLRRRIVAALAASDPEEPPPVPVVKNGIAKISDPDQIPETYCDISSKDEGERYLGLKTGIVYKLVNPWDLDG